MRTSLIGCLCLLSGCGSATALEPDAVDLSGSMVSGDVGGVPFELSATAAHLTDSVSHLGYQTIHVTLAELPTGVRGSCADPIVGRTLVVGAYDMSGSAIPTGTYYPAGSELGPAIPTGVALPPDSDLGAYADIYWNDFETSPGFNVIGYGLGSVTFSEISAEIVRGSFDTPIKASDKTGQLTGTFVAHVCKTD
jgi:hypothetical protein